MISPPDEFVPRETAREAYEMKFTPGQVDVISVALDHYRPRRDDEEIARPLAWHFRYHAARHVIELAGALAMARAVGIDPPLDDDSDGGENPEFDRAVRVGRAMQIAACRVLQEECPLLRVVSTKQNREELIRSRDDAWPELSPVIDRATQAALEAGRRGDTSDAERPNHLPEPQAFEMDDITAPEMRVLLDALRWAVRQQGYYSRQSDGGSWPRAAADVPPLLTAAQENVAISLIADLARELGETQIYLPTANYLAETCGIPLDAAERALAAAEKVLGWYCARCARVDAETFQTLNVPRELLAVRDGYFLTDQQQRGLVAAEQTLWQHIHRAQSAQKGGTQ